MNRSHWGVGNVQSVVQHLPVTYFPKMGERGEMGEGRDRGKSSAMDVSNEGTGKRGKRREWGAKERAKEPVKNKLPFSPCSGLCCCSK